MVVGINRVQADHAPYGTTTKTMNDQCVTLHHVFTGNVICCDSYGMVCAYFSGIKSE